VLAHLQRGQPTELAEKEEVGGEDGERVEEEVEPLTHQVLARQHAQAEEHHEVGEDVVGFQGEENRRAPINAPVGIGEAGRKVLMRLGVHLVRNSVFVFWFFVLAL